MNFKFLLGVSVFASLIVVSYNVDAFADSSNNVYQIPDVSFDKYSYTWGEQGKLFMVSALDNKDPQKIEVITANNSTFESTLYVQPNLSKSQNFILTETGLDTGVFEWTFIISEPGTEESYDVDSNYIAITDSVESIIFQFDVGLNAGYSTSAKITHPNDNTLPSDEQRQRIHSMYPNIQFRIAEMTSPYDGYGIVSVQYPNQNKSPAVVDQLKVVFSIRGVNSIFEVLNETGPDTGIFNGPLSISSYPSFSKIQLTKDDGESRRIAVQYLVSDSLSSSFSNSITLHHELEYQDNDMDRIQNNSNLSVHSDKKAYLSDQPIRVYGSSEPDEIIHVTLSSSKNSEVLFDKVHADVNGRFEIEFTWPNAAPSSGMYKLTAVSIKNNVQDKNQIMITSIEDLQSYGVTIPPRQQSEMGLDADQIVCKRVWKLVLKPGGDVPACVKLPTYHKLLERGWGPVP